MLTVNHNNNSWLPCQLQLATNQCATAWQWKHRGPSKLVSVAWNTQWQWCPLQLPISVPPFRKAQKQRGMRSLLKDGRAQQRKKRNQKREGKSALEMETEAIEDQSQGNSETVEKDWEGKQKSQVAGKANPWRLERRLRSVISGNVWRWQVGLF